MSEKSLYKLVNDAMGEGDNNKVLIGYTVSSYSGVLSALEKARTGGGGTAVMGVERIDFTSVGTIQYNNLGFSTDPDAPVWKMALNITGGCPVQKDTWYEILKFPNENEQTMNNLGNRAMLPLTLSEDIANNFPYENFATGVFIDAGVLAVQYFNEFYRKADTDKFTEDQVSKLVGAGLLQAQLIFPSKNKYEVATVLGRTAFSKHATCYITTPLLAASGWQDCGITVSVTENNQNPQEFLPNGTTYTCPFKGNTYYKSNGTLMGFNRKAYKDWFERRKELYDSDGKVLELQKPAPGECFVKLFVPLDKKDKAMAYLPNNVSDRIFAPYGGKIIRTQAVSSGVTGDAASMISHTAFKWASVATNSGNGTINYSMDLRPGTLKRGCGGTINSQQGSFSPIFGHPSNSYYYDCSSLVTMILYDSGVIRDDVTSVRAFASGEWAGTTALNTINSHLKPEYQAVFMNIDSTTVIQPGDVLIVTAAQRGKKSGHVALAVPENGKTYTVEIGGSDYTRPLKVYYGRSEAARNYYRHLIRIVEKQSTTT